MAALHISCKEDKRRVFTNLSHLTLKVVLLHTGNVLPPGSSQIYNPHKRNGQQHETTITHHQLNEKNKWQICDAPNSLPS